VALALRVFKIASLSSSPTCNTVPSCPCVTGTDADLLPIVGTEEGLVRSAASGRINQVKRRSHDSLHDKITTPIRLLCMVSTILMAANQGPLRYVTVYTSQ
jgi:hypothetical protein